jgi:hypothetical protein
VYLFALRVCGFTCGVVKGKSYVALALVYLFALQVRGFTGSVVQGKSRVCGSSTHEFICPAGM